MMNTENSTDQTMASTLFEIAELPNGDVVLRKVDEDAEPLVCLRFSAESLAQMGDGKFEIAKAMIEAGMEAATELLGEQPDDFFDDYPDYEKPLLH